MRPAWSTGSSGPDRVDRGRADPSLLARQDAAYQLPTTDLLSWLYKDGVRWLWADLRDGWVVPDRLDQLAMYGQLKMNTYIYTPKDDPYLRDQYARFVRLMLAAGRQP